MEAPVIQAQLLKMKKLMTEIFVSEEPRLRIRVCASYRFDLNGSVAPQWASGFWRGVW